ncbi:hypothetical protein Vadar_024174 [Vaccinium darrowii]|uniref:Uncharacterized protein n=1 Tax=Vaccinium darrowii TaxID=229202 RepID=A0ACB7Z676_9ERIC|nr:hypothetical protein Vadar_024174 [Vaccinium darrowii]
MEDWHKADSATNSRSGGGGHHHHHHGDHHHHHGHHHGGGGGGGGGGSANNNISITFGKLSLAKKPQGEIMLGIKSQIQTQMYLVSTSKKVEKKFTINVQPVGSEWFTRSVVANLKELTTSEMVQNAFTESKFTKNWFISIKPWNGEAAGTSRLVWLKYRAMDEVLEFKQVPEDKRVSLVATRLRGRVAAWWQQLKQTRLRQEKDKISSWEKLNKKMRVAFLPHNYSRLMYQRLQNLRQNSRSVDDYTTKFHQLVARNDLAETEEQLVSRPSSTPWSATARPTVGNTSTKPIASLPPTNPPAIRAGASSGSGSKCFECEAAYDEEVMEEVVGDNGPLLVVRRLCYAPCEAEGDSWLRGAMDSVILLCKYHGESCRIRMFRDSKFLHLYEKLSCRWSSLKSAGVKFSYSLPGDPCCLIQNDEDLEVMLDMMFKPGCHEIYVSIIDCGSSSSGSTTYGCSRTSEVLSSFRGEWSLDVDKEVDLMPSF